MVLTTAVRVQRVFMIHKLLEKQLSEYTSWKNLP